MFTPGTNTRYFTDFTELGKHLHIPRGPNLSQVCCWRKCHRCLTPGADIIFAMSIRWQMHLCCIFVLRYERSESEVKAYLDTFAFLCLVQRHQNMPKFRIEKPGLKRFPTHKIQHSRGAHTRFHSHTHCLFLFVPHTGVWII